MFKKIKKGIFNMANEISKNLMENNKAKYDAIRKGMELTTDVIKKGMESTTDVIKKGMETTTDVIKASGKVIVKIFEDNKNRRIVGIIAVSVGAGLIASSYVS